MSYHVTLTDEDVVANPLPARSLELVVQGRPDITLTRHRHTSTFLLVGPGDPDDVILALLERIPHTLTTGVTP